MKKIMILFTTILLLWLVPLVFAQVNCSATALYCDEFQTDSNWYIAREDLDQTVNELSYQPEDLVLHVRDRWDFAVAAPP